MRRIIIASRQNLYTFCIGLFAAGCFHSENYASCPELDISSQDMRNVAVALSKTHTFHSSDGTLKVIISLQVKQSDVTATNALITRTQPIGMCNPVQLVRYEGTQSIVWTPTNKPPIPLTTDEELGALLFLDESGSVHGTLGTPYKKPPNEAITEKEVNDWGGRVEGDFASPMLVSLSRTRWDPTIEEVRDIKLVEQGQLVSFEVQHLNP